MQCKERVDLLEALKESRKEAGKEFVGGDSLRKRLEKGKTSDTRPTERSSSWLGDGTVPPVQYPDLSKPHPTLPRPHVYGTRSTETLKDREKERAASVPHLPPIPHSLSAAPALALPVTKTSRSPSPDSNRKTMRTTLRTSDRTKFRSPRTSASQQSRRPAAGKAAGMAWETRTGSAHATRPSKTEADRTIQARLSATAARRSLDITPVTTHEADPGPSVRMPDPADYIPNSHWRDTSYSNDGRSLLDQPLDKLDIDNTSAPDYSSYMDDLLGLETPQPPAPPPHSQAPLNPLTSKTRRKSPTRPPPPPEISYRKEYPQPAARPPPPGALRRAYRDSEDSPTSPEERPSSSSIARKPVANSATARATRPKASRRRGDTSSGSGDELREDEPTRKAPPVPKPRRSKSDRANTVTPPSTDADSNEGEEEREKAAWDKKVAHVMKNLPKGIDEQAAKQVLNEIVVNGDEVHWSDVAGLEHAKKALKEAVVYPFLRPDLFMGLREPARGMLLFGPPGTGKTMLARAVATESKSTFFAISASSLTSKWHGESEKLVRALFGLAKALAPSIIFVDEIDSLLSARSSSSEHEASRRSKTEFLIQWSDLQKAAAGRDTKGEVGDASRVLVLAATNVPWDIDDAARRRFVRRQYIPLPEDETRETQLRTLLGHQKHDLSKRDILTLTGLTDGECKQSASLLSPHTNVLFCRLLRLRHHGPGERRGNGSAAQSGRGPAVYADGSDQADLLRRL